MAAANPHFVSEEFTHPADIHPGIGLTVHAKNLRETDHWRSFSVVAGPKLNADAFAVGPVMVPMSCLPFIVIDRVSSKKGIVLCSERAQSHF